MVGSSGESGLDRTRTGADANGRTVPHMACRLEKPIFDCFPHTGRGVGLLTRGEVERTMVSSGRWESNPHSQRPERTPGASCFSSLSPALALVCLAECRAGADSLRP